MSDELGRFKEECLQKGGNPPNAVRIEGTKRKNEAERLKNQSQYHEKGSRELLQGETSLLAIKEGYYAMLHKANEALALAGFKVNTHVCTIIGISQIFDASELADKLREAGEKRLNVDYFMNPEKSDLEDPQEFIENIMEPFLKQIEELIEKENLR